MVTVEIIKIEDDKDKDVLQYVKLLRYPGRDIPLLFRIHKGFNSLDELKEYLRSKKIEYKNISVIYFLNMYYVVAFEDYNRQFMIGRNNYFYTNDKYMLIQGKAPNFKPKFYPAFLREKVYKHFQLFYDLEMIDPNIDILKNDVSVKNEHYAKAYAIILGLTFFSTYIKREEVLILDNYFSQDYFYVFRDNPNILGINPFKSKVIYNDGKISNYQFYNKKENTQYWAYRHYPVSY